MSGRISDARLAEIAAAVGAYMKTVRESVWVGIARLRISELADLCADLADARANAPQPHAAGQQGAVASEDVPEGMEAPISPQLAARRLAELAPLEEAALAAYGERPSSPWYRGGDRGLEVTVPEDVAFVRLATPLAVLDLFSLARAVASREATMDSGFCDEPTLRCEAAAERAAQRAQDGQEGAAGARIRPEHPAPATVDVASIRGGHMPVTRTQEWVNDGKGGLYGWTQHFDPPICAACREPWGADGCTVVRLCDALEAERARVAMVARAAEPLRKDHSLTRDGDVMDIDHGPIVEWETCECGDDECAVLAVLAALAASRGGSGAGG